MFIKRKVKYLGKYFMFLMHSLSLLPRKLLSSSGFVGRERDSKMSKEVKYGNSISVRTGPVIYESLNRFNMRVAQGIVYST